MRRYEFIEPFIEHQGEKRGFWLRRPRGFGQKILVARYGSRVPVSQRDKKVVFLDFKSAFGTGGHGTTEGCLLALEKYIGGGETVLDVGTGTGILAIAACRLGSGQVTAIDINRAACNETRKNLALNGIDTGIEVMEGDLKTVQGQFDIIAANLRTPVLCELLEELIRKLTRFGIAIFSGILETELPFFLSLLENSPLETLETKRIHGWITLSLRNRADI